MKAIDLAYVRYQTPDLPRLETFLRDFGMHPAVPCDGKRLLRGIIRPCNKLLAEQGPFVEVWAKAPLEECARRDVKGLYAKALAGEIQHFTGVDDPYEDPEDAEVVADTVALTPDESVALVVAELERIGVVPDAARAAG